MTGRLTWLDLARGFAVISMIVAHTSPWGGLLNASEYLTAPWFAMLIGISLLVAWEKAGGWVVFVFGNVARGLLLILLGEWLQRQYGQIDIVLQTLGLLIIVLAPIVALVGSRPAVWAGLGLVMALVSPLVMDATRAWLAGGEATWWLGRFLELSVAGGHYRVSSFIAICGSGWRPFRCSSVDRPSPGCGAPSVPSGSWSAQARPTRSGGWAHGAPTPIRGRHSRSSEPPC